MPPKYGMHPPLPPELSPKSAPSDFSKAKGAGPSTRQNAHPVDAKTQSEEQLEFELQPDLEPPEKLRREQKEERGHVRYPSLIKPGTRGNREYYTVRFKYDPNAKESQLFNLRTTDLHIALARRDELMWASLRGIPEEDVIREWQMRADQQDAFRRSLNSHRPDGGNPTTTLAELRRALEYDPEVPRHLIYTIRRWMRECLIFDHGYSTDFIHQLPIEVLDNAYLYLLMGSRLERLMLSGNGIRANEIQSLVKHARIWRDSPPLAHIELPNVFSKITEWADQDFIKRKYMNQNREKYIPLHERLISHLYSCLFEAAHNPLRAENSLLLATYWGFNFAPEESFQLFNTTFPKFSASQIAIGQRRMSGLLNPIKEREKKLNKTIAEFGLCMRLKTRPPGCNIYDFCEIESRYRSISAGWIQQYFDGFCYQGWVEEQHLRLRSILTKSSQ